MYVYEFATCEASIECHEVTPFLLEYILIEEEHSQAPRTRTHDGIDN